MVESHVLESKIRDGLGDVRHLEIRDLTGTKDHWEATVVSPAFEGKNRVQQHQMIYRALGDLMSGPVHALKLTTLTPAQWDETPAKP